MQPLATASEYTVIDLRDPKPDRTVAIARWAGLLVLALLQVADLVTTKFAIHGGAIEANPISRALIAHGAINAAKFGALALLAFSTAKSRPRVITAVAIWFVAGIYSMIVFSNLLVISQIR
jgi:hypothetical protein